MLTSQPFFLAAQNTPKFPNGNFENWAAFSPCAAIDSIANFISLDETLNHLDPSFCNTSPSIFKSIDAYSGNYAVKMTGYYHLGDGVGANQISIGNNIAENGRGIPFTGRPKKLVGYYKFTKGGSDTLGITLSSYSTYAGEIFNEKLTITSSVLNYTRFEIILNYDVAIADNPTNLNFTIAIGNTNHQADASTVLYIDDLTFEYATTTSTTNYSATSPINVYAANKNINFSENVSDVHVVDMVGASKMEETTTTKTLNVASLTTGMYIVTYKYNDAYFSKKVVIE